MTPQNINYTKKSDIFISCSEKKFRAIENMVDDHGLTHIVSGSMSVVEADRSYTLSEGETVVFRRNQLGKFTKNPSGDDHFRCITILFKQPFLQKYYSKNQLGNASSKGIKVRIKPIIKHPLLTGLFNSILPYYEMNEQLPRDLTEMKLVEALTILRSIDKGVDAILSEFAEPGKIDLDTFMQRNYSFNLPMHRFAYLTGRSLSTFKRDFKKTYNESPEKWLRQKRLEQAHFLIAEKKQKPSEAYMEVGFENLSHFSAAFKQFFGYSPSSVSLSR